MSKTRYAIPRIKVKPVQLSGTIVQYCTGYNAKYHLLFDNNNIPIKFTYISHFFIINYL